MMPRTRGPSLIVLTLFALLLAFPPEPALPADSSDDPERPSTAHVADDKTRIVQAEPDAQAPPDPFAEDPFATEDTDDVPVATIPDPLESWNRGMFWVNDKLILYGLRPAARGYRTVFPRAVRQSLRNVFNNLGEPTHVLNALLQGRPAEAGRATGRFVLNSTFGVGGLFDPAGDHLEPVDRGFDQTFAKWGTPTGLYLVWPLIGPSSARGTVAYTAGIYTDPLAYVEGEDSLEASAGLFVLRTVNDYSFRIGEYKSMKKHALDPYVSLKNLYEQNLHQRRRD